LIDHELFQDLITFPSQKRSAAIAAGNLAIGECRVGEDPNEAVRGSTCRTHERIYARERALTRRSQNFFRYRPAVQRARSKDREIASTRLCIADRLF
jgi:hypothetical protein